MTREHIILLSAALALAPCVRAAQAEGRAVREHFNTIFAPSRNPNSEGEPTDGVFKVDGNYCVPYSGQYTNEMNMANVTFTTGQGGAMADLTVQPGTHISQFCGGVRAYGAAELATAGGWEPSGPVPPFGPSTYGYGYYETRMQPSCVQGEVSSFFWIQAPGYGPLEIDVEFPDPPGHDFSDVNWTIHPSGRTVDYHLGFNPCQAFHRYGFLWTAGQVVFTVDGVAEQTFMDGTLVSNETGFIMANAWTGNPNWGGGPPTQPAINSYGWIVYAPNATRVPGGR